jgi:hypothetical protein
MPKITQQSVDEVKRAADVVAVVQAYGVTLKRQGSAWVGRCPFHEEKSGSFNVREGKGYKCFGCGASGDALKFVMEKEGCEFVEAVEKMASKFGVMLRYETPPAPAGAQGGAAPAPSGFQLPEGVDPKQAARAMRRQANYERARADEARLEEELARAWQPKVARRRVPGWSVLVQERWYAGTGTDRELMELASARGWPEGWVAWLMDEGLISWPALPWRDDEREVAFRVDAMVDAAGVWSLDPVGYHQRFLVDGRKNWAFVPYLPAADKRRTVFQRGLGAEQEPLAADEMAGLPPLPFVLGRPAPGVRLCVVTEGQWDAVTFAGAAGWLAGDQAWPEEVLVLGARGANGVDTLLAWWGAWLESVRPNVLVLADNDTAGRKWDVPAPMDARLPGSPLLPTFAEKLLKRPGELAGEPDWVQRARRVTVQRVKAAHGKDFNDYWKARKPDVAAVLNWLTALGLRSREGNWL